MFKLRRYELKTKLRYFYCTVFAVYVVKALSNSPETSYNERIYILCRCATSRFQLDQLQYVEMTITLQLPMMPMQGWKFSHSPNWQNGLRKILFIYLRQILFIYLRSSSYHLQGVKRLVTQKI